jgi:phenylpropionate dioxygenase-like ring-hydroxylating dioxygenase large terminal subunit
MYINFWCPTVRSQDLEAGKAQRVKTLGVNLVAWRGEDGEAHIQVDTFVHRGGALSKGQVKDNCIVCPYHGWRFGPDGKAVLIRSLGPDAKLPARAKIDSYPAQEKYGIVFAFLGDLPEEERPPIYDVTEFGAHGWRGTGIVVLDIDAYHERSMENGVDPPHVRQLGA